MSKYDLLLKSGHVVVRQNGEYKTVQTDLGLKNGRIEEMRSIPPEQAANVIKADHLHILPGLIDTQVHFREPGLEHKETLNAGSRGAALGGITGVFEMPNTKPLTVTALDLKDKLTRANGKMWCDYAFYLGSTPDNLSKLADLEKLPGCAGIKTFMGSSTGSLLISEDEHLEKIIQNIQRRAAFHAEDEARLKERKHLVEEKPGHPEMHPVWRDEKSAFIATEKLVKLAKKYNKQVHVLHVSTAEEMEFLKNYKDVASVETLPQFLTLTAPECYERLGTFAQMNPPIREKRHQDALWKALNSGVVDVLGSDHAPHTIEEKKQVYPKSPSGMPGVQTIVPVMLDHVSKGRLTLYRLVELLASKPAELFNISGRGEIAKGMEATFTIVDLKKTKTIENKWIASVSGWTPFDGMKITGWPVMTMIRGQIVMRDDELIGGPRGKPFFSAPEPEAAGTGSYSNLS